MTVRQAPYPSRRDAYRAALDRQRTALPWRATGLLAFLGGMTLWLVGARFTVLGVPFVLEALFDLFGLAIRVVLPSGWPLLGLTIGLGLVMSLVEFGCRPRRTFFAAGLFAAVLLLMLWLAVNAADLTSTYFGVRNPVADAWSLTRQVADSTRLSVAWTVVLTYCPELLILVGLRWVWRGQF